MQPRHEEMNKANAAAMGQAAGGNAQRIGQLENRVRRLEATLDSVLQKLDRIEKSQTGQEKHGDPQPK